MKDKIIGALITHAEGHIAKHVVNVNILMEKAQGVAEHPDVMETIEKELDIIAKYEDQLDVLKKYFL
jgi:hypothetical protein